MGTISDDYLIGQPLPPSNRDTRLDTRGMVGPHCADSGTTFRINSTFMDVSDAGHVPHGGLAGTGMAATMAIIAYALAIFVADDYADPYPVLFVMLAVAVCGACAYLVRLICHYGVFGLSRHTVRFNRKTQTIHTVRKRRFFASDEEGDETWSIPWDSKQMFCLHQQTGWISTSYRIRHYQLDDNGKVLRTVCIGRAWSNRSEPHDQWTYWCHYMNEGPANLPRPRLFLAEDEPLWESYAISQSGHMPALPLMLLMAPFTLALTLARGVWLITCRAPRWPSAIIAASTIDPHDMHAVPRQGTPVGFVRTRWAVLRSRYPDKPFFKVSNVGVQWSTERSGNRANKQEQVTGPRSKRARRLKAKQTKGKAKAARQQKSRNALS